MTEFLGAKTKLSKVVAEERLLKLEIEMIDKHGLTLPHRTYPWNSSERRNEVRRKQEVLEEVRVDRARSLSDICCGLDARKRVRATVGRVRLGGNMWEV